MPKYRFSFDWFSQDIPHLTKFLAKFQGKPVQMIEIGSFEGRSAVWFLTHILTHPQASLTCIDTFTGSLEHQKAGIDFSQIEKNFDENIKKTKTPARVIKIKGQSQLILPKLPFASYDVIYIDGSHKASDVLEDAVYSFRLLKKGGLLIFDDYDWPVNLPPEEKPKLAIDAFLRVFKGQYQLLFQKGQLIIRKI